MTHIIAHHHRYGHLPVALVRLSAAEWIIGISSVGAYGPAPLRDVLTDAIRGVTALSDRTPITAPGLIDLYDIRRVLRDLARCIDDRWRAAYEEEVPHG